MIIAREWVWGIESIWEIVRHGYGWTAAQAAVERGDHCWRGRVGVCVCGSGEREKLSRTVGQMYKTLLTLKFITQCMRPCVRACVHRTFTHTQYKLTQYNGCWWVSTAALLLTVSKRRWRQRRRRHDACLASSIYARLSCTVSAY